MVTGRARRFRTPHALAYIQWKRPGAGEKDNSRLCRSRRRKAGPEADADRWRFKKKAVWSWRTIGTAGVWMPIKVLYGIDPKMCM